MQKFVQAFLAKKPYGVQTNMEIIKIIVLLGKYQIILFASENFIIKETYDSLKINSKILYDFQNCLVYSEYIENDTIIKNELEELDYIGESWALEGFNLFETIHVGEPFLYKNFPSIEVEQLFSFPNSKRQLKSKAIYSNRFDIDLFFSDKRILDILFFKDRPSNIETYDFEMSRVYYINNHEFIHKEVQEVSFINKETNFFTNVKSEFEMKLITNTSKSKK